MKDLLILSQRQLDDGYHELCRSLHGHEQIIFQAAQSITAGAKKNKSFQ